jgi:hypothetical protein
MPRRSWLSLPLALVVALSAPAQQRHKFDDSDAYDTAALKRRVHQAETSELDRLVQEILDHPEMLKLSQEDLERIRNHPKFQDQQFRDQIRQSLDRHKLTDEQKKKWERVFSDKTPPDPGRLKNSDPPEVGHRPPEGKQPDDTRPPETPPDGKSGSDTGGKTSADRTTALRKATMRRNAGGLRRDLTRRLTRWALEQETSGDPHRQEIMRSTLRRLVRAGLLADRSGDGPGRLAVVDGLSRGTRSLMPEGFRLPLPSWLGNARAPATPTMGGSFSAPSVPNGPSSGSATVLLWAFILVCLGLLAWKTLGSPRQARGQGGAGWRLGPWPVRPNQVANRGDLVRAFEYLACLLLGPKALTRHHLELAADLGDTEEATPTRREAAARLAHLYEQARYAPPNEPLPDEELAIARRDLSSLAGVAAA